MIRYENGTKQVSGAGTEDIEFPVKITEMKQVQFRKRKYSVKTTDQKNIPVSKRTNKWIRLRNGKYPTPVSRTAYPVWKTGKRKISGL